MAKIICWVKEKLHISQKAKIGALPFSETILGMSKAELVSKMWDAAPKVKAILQESDTLESARSSLKEYLDSMYAHEVSAREMRRAGKRQRLFQQLIEPDNEKTTGSSALVCLWRIARQEPRALEGVSEGFLLEFIYLFRGLRPSAPSAPTIEFIEEINPQEKALARSGRLDEYSQTILDHYAKYVCGMDKAVIEKRKAARQRIMDFFGADESAWNDPKWHLGHIIRDKAVLAKLVELNTDEKRGLDDAARFNIPFQITPYYLSLFDAQGRSEMDRALRAIVLPTAYYCQTIAAKRKSGQDMDYMGEKYTSPVELITRRYPQIVILKPFDSCPQICQYCQRNWEIKPLGEKQGITSDKIDRAIRWIASRPTITEVLVTGGDPLTLGNERLESILSKLAEIPHVVRIRIGTRTIVTMPMRIDEGLLATVKQYHQWGRREICFVTHFEHPSEITPESAEAVRRLKDNGINVYNQQVFIYHNSRRFETAYLRHMLKLIGADPYYTFNTKGKDETRDFRVPIARLKQERKEEARLLPGAERTDEFVFNIPRLGKSHLRAEQDHEVIMILPDGRRVYRFDPWETKNPMAEPYIYTDVSIAEYLGRLKKDGEKIEDYKTIWYY